MHRYQSKRLVRACERPSIGNQGGTAEQHIPSLRSLSDLGGFFIAPEAAKRKEKNNMKKISICDMTLCPSKGAYSFKEKIEIARQLGNLCVDAIEIPEIVNVRTDVLLVKTISSFVKKSVISVDAGGSAQGIENAAAALANTAMPRIRVSLPVSVVGMEYGYHKKGPKMLELIKKLVSAAKEKCADVEFCALDATRAEEGFLPQVAAAAISSGATSFTICDSEGIMMPDEFAAFAADFISASGIDESIKVGIMCRDLNGLAAASAILAVKSGASAVKTACGSDITDLETFAGIIKNCGTSGGFGSDIKFTQLSRIISQISRITKGAVSSDSVAPVSSDDNIRLDAKDGIDAVAVAVKKLGYDLSAEDEAKVFEEFRRVAEKKAVGAKELDAIVASSALQVPATFKLISYVVNTGNIISSSAQIKLSRDDREISGISMGDGPIDAAFVTIEQIIGHHYELDDFQIQAVTEGKEAMGSAIVKLRSNGKLYSGNGISTDIVGASIRAYLNALNKIVYEEA